MKISISAVTRNRALSKRIVRLCNELDRFRGLADDIGTDDLEFDTLQIVFTDNPREFIDVVPPRFGDRLLQVRVGMPGFQGGGPSNDSDLLIATAEALEKALDCAGLDELRLNLIKRRCRALEF